jgi:hypothetical protein
VKRLAAAWADRCQAADRITRGTSIIYRRRADALTAWVRAGRRDDLDGWRAALGPLVRLAMLGAAAAALYGIVRAVPWLMWLVTGAWLRAAWKAGKLSTETAEEEPDEAPAEPGRDAVLTLLTDLIADRPGVHLATVLAHLHERGQGEGWTVTDVRARLAALGVPSRRSVKVDRRVAWGVHRDDLPTPTPAEPAERAA